MKSCLLHSFSSTCSLEKDDLSITPFNKDDTYRQNPITSMKNLNLSSNRQDASNNKLDVSLMQSRSQGKKSNTFGKTETNNQKFKEIEPENAKRNTSITKYQCNQFCLDPTSNQIATQKEKFLDKAQSKFPIEMNFQQTSQKRTIRNNRHMFTDAQMRSSVQQFENKIVRSQDLNKNQGIFKNNTNQICSISNHIRNYSTSREIQQETPYFSSISQTKIKSEEKMYSQERNAFQLCQIPQNLFMERSFGNQEFNCKNQFDTIQGVKRNSFSELGLEGNKNYDIFSFQHKKSQLEEPMFVTSCSQYEKFHKQEPPLFSSKKNLNTNLKENKRSEKSFSVLYRLFFDFFPEGIVFIDHELNVIYSNHSSRILTQCTDCDSIRDAIFGLSSITSQENISEQVIAANIKSKGSLESFSNSNQIGSFSSEKQISYSKQNKSSNHKDYQACENNNNPIILSSQNILKNDIKKNLIKTQEFIKQNNLDSVDQNMILSEVTMFNSKLTRSKLNNDNYNNQQNYQPSQNLSFSHSGNSQGNQNQGVNNNNNNNNQNSTFKLNNGLPFQAQTQSFQENQKLKSGINQNNLVDVHIIPSYQSQQVYKNNQNNNTHTKQNYLDPKNIENKDCSNSIQIAITNSIYASTLLPNHHLDNQQTLSHSPRYHLNKGIITENNNNPSIGKTGLQPEVVKSFSNQNFSINSNSSQKNNINNAQAATQNQISLVSCCENQTNQGQKRNMTSFISKGNGVGNGVGNEIKSQQCSINSNLCSLQINQNSHLNNIQNNELNQGRSQAQNTCGWGLKSTYSFKNLQVSQQSQEKKEIQTIQIEVSLFGAIIEGKEMVVVMMRDVTHRKYIELLKEANQQKQQVVSYLSHELRNPLNCIINMLDSVEYELQGFKNSGKMSMDDEKRGEIENNVSTALQNSKYILNLSNDYLDMARIKANQFKLNIQPFNLQQLLTECIKLFSIQAEKVNTQIILQNKVLKNKFILNYQTINKNIVYSDVERVKQVVINLISNALKFTHNGQIFVKSEYISHQQLQIQIKDTGIGIEQNNLKQLFKAFGKIDDEENQQFNQQGVGLGLLISNMLSIQLSKLTIDPVNLQKNNANQGLKVQSEKGVGSTFILTLTDHNPQSFNTNITNLKKNQEILQIVETQESSIKLSSTPYSIKRSQALSNNINIEQSEDKNQQKEQSFDQSSKSPCNPREKINRLMSQSTSNIVNSLTQSEIDFSIVKKDIDYQSPSPIKQKKNIIFNDTFSEMEEEEEEEEEDDGEDDDENEGEENDERFYNENNLPLANVVKQGQQIKNKFFMSKQTETEDLVTPFIESAKKIICSQTSEIIKAQQRLHPIKKNLENLKRSSVLTGLSLLGDEDVLIVDDNIFCCEALKNIIEKRFGLRCQMCFSAIKAVEAVKQRYSKYQRHFGTKNESKKNKIKITNSLRDSSQLDKKDESTFHHWDVRFYKFIFMDINMPDMDGFEGLYLIKSFLFQINDKFEENCRIIGCSGIDEKIVEDQKEFSQNPLTQFDGFLFKPVLKEKLQQFFSYYGISILK